VSESDFRPSEPDDALTSDGTPPVDAPEADAAEQRQPVMDENDETPISVPYDVDPADASEQHRTVEFDEDDYR
jgi:hypothetical protein